MTLVPFVLLVIAERLNGYAAFVGCWALIGAYLTTGQIIPGVV
ncbi:high light inducible protein [Prochlorococcus sp. MIT 1011]